MTLRRSKPRRWLLAAFLVAAAARLPAQAPPETPPPDERPPAASSGTAAEAPAGEPVPSWAPAGTAWIERDGLRRHADYLASDELGGRYTGTAGQRKAANYIAAHFESLGLLPLGDKAEGGRGYLQAYPLERTWLEPEHTALEIGEERLDSGFAVIQGRGGGKVAVRGRFVFCGDGSPDRLPRAAMRRAIPVVVLDERGGRGERGGRDGSGAMAMMRGMRSVLRAAAINRELASRGAQVVVFCLPDADSGTGDALNYGALLPGKPLLAFGNDRGRPLPPHRVPSVFVAGPTADVLFAALGVTATANGYAADPDAKAEGAVRLSVDVDPKFHAVNVVGYLEGADSAAAKEAIVFSAHMDHMGTRLDGDAFNGADDNASGTAALLEIAEAFARGERPRRSVVFLAVSGEELGLWGSQHFSEHPTWPLARIAANVNIDMIGRDTSLSPPNVISVTPSFQHPQYSTLVRTASELAAAAGMRLSNGDTYYERSDHYNFAKKGVPVVFFCDGEHVDYHKVSDHADKLDHAKMERVARLAYWTGFDAAQAKGRPQRLGSQDSW